MKGLVEMHGGTVTAESAGPGKGSTFTVRCRSCMAPARARSAATARRRQPPRGSKRRILVVDDNRDVGPTRLADGCSSSWDTKSARLTMASKRSRRPSGSTPRSS